MIDATMVLTRAAYRKLCALADVGDDLLRREVDTLEQLRALEARYPGDVQRQAEHLQARRALARAPRPRSTMFRDLAETEPETVAKMATLLGVTDAEMVLIADGLLDGAGLS